jgi:hypothetical protein
VRVSSARGRYHQGRGYQREYEEGGGAYGQNEAELMDQVANTSVKVSK